MNETGLSRRGVQTNLRGLEEKNLIACKNGRHGGRYASAKYTLLHENWDEFQGHSEEREIQRSECAPSEGKQRSDCPKGRTGCQNSAVGAENCAVRAENRAVRAENRAVGAPESVKESVKESVLQAVRQSSSPASPGDDDDGTDGQAVVGEDSTQPESRTNHAEFSAREPKKRVLTDGRMLIDLSLRFCERAASGPHFTSDGYWFFADPKTGTIVPKRHHARFFLSQIREKGIQWVRLVVKTFAGDEDNDFSRICPAAVLMKRWGEYEDIAVEKQRSEQDPSRWQDVADHIEEDFGFELTESQKKRIRDLATHHGTGRLEDAYFTYHADCLGSGLDEFLADPSLYLEDELLAA